MEQEVDLKTVQQYTTGILCYIDKVCRENQITYYLAYGSLLGAIRHQGFIPWDDDIDILMPRPDFEKFLQLTSQSPDPRYRLYCVENEARWTAPLPKVVDTHTILHQTNHREKMDLGLYVDVFVLEGVPAQPRTLAAWRKKLDLLQKLWGGCEYEKRPLAKGTFLKNSCKNAVSVFLDLLIGSRRASIALCKEAAKYPFADSDTVTTAQYHVYPWHKDSTTKQILGQGCDVTFEGHSFRAPQQWDAYLKNLYGDYMQLPPVEERAPHHTYHLEFTNKGE